MIGSTRYRRTCSTQGVDWGIKLTPNAGVLVLGRKGHVLAGAPATPNHIPLLGINAIPEVGS